MENPTQPNQFPGSIHSKRRKSFYTTPIFRLAVGGAALLIIAFGSGIAYQKGKTPAAAQAAGTTQTSRFGGMQGFGGGMRNTNRAFGTVSAVSDTSITVTTRSSTSATYSISSSTTVTNSGSSASISDIQTGDTVILTLASSDSKTVTAIALNPSFGGPSGSGTGSSTGTGTDDSSSSSSSSSTSSI